MVEIGERATWRAKEREERRERRYNIGDGTMRKVKGKQEKGGGG